MGRHKRFENAEALAAPLVERRTPATGPGTLQSDVIVPACQATITGGVTGILAGAVAAMTGARQAAAIGAAVGGLVLAGVWLLLLSDRRQLLWTTERVLHTDLDHDGAIGEPEPPPLTRLELVDRDRRQVRYVDLPLSDQQLEALARAVLRPGATFSRRSLPDGLLSPEVYSDLVARLLAAGLLVQRGRGLEAGVELTAAGRSWLRRYL